MTVTPPLDCCEHGYCETEHCRACEIMGVCKACEARSAAKVDPLDTLEEKWRTEPADLAEWANRATRTLALARKWKRAALEWEDLARKEAETT